MIGEELGFLGVCAIIGLYALLVGRALYVGHRCIGRNRHFAGYIAFGIALWIGMQAFVSIGVNLGLLPTKGLTLPLISSGGSSVLMTCAAMGLLLRVSYELSRAEKHIALTRGIESRDQRDEGSSPQVAPVTTRARAGEPARSRHRPGPPCAATRARSASNPLSSVSGDGRQRARDDPGRRHRRPHLPRAGRGQGAARARVPVTWLGADGQMETRLVPQHDIALDTIAVKGLRGKGAAALLGAPLRIAAAVMAAAGVLRRRAPRAVISFGGYAAGPGGVAARLQGRPLLVHEQNRAPGMTNKLLSRVARRVLTGFPGSFATREEAVGNPVREEIAAIAPPRERLAGREGPLRLLVLGGSRARARSTPPCRRRWPR